MYRRIKIGIADDHLVVREGYISMFKETERFEVIFHVENGQELLRRVRQREPDIVLLDIQMPVMDGIAALEVLRKEHPEVKVIMLTGLHDPFYAVESLERGASAFLLKGTGIEELVKIITHVHENGAYYNEEIIKALKGRATLRRPNKYSQPRVQFSKREKEVLKLLCENQSTKEIVTNLGIKVKTVEWHKYNMMKKTNSKKLTSLIIFAFREKII